MQEYRQRLQLKVDDVDTSPSVSRDRRRRLYYHGYIPWSDLAVE